MRKLTKLAFSAVAGILLAMGVGGLGATPALAFEAKCTPSASISQTGGYATASGKAMCQIEQGNIVGVTVVLYVQGWNEGSSYTECAADFLSDCVGIDVGYPTATSDICARTIVTYETTGQRHTRSTSTGQSCPF
ncbi:hypothetical protein [Cryobacterium sp. N19]|uniref:hypothetical protein n=1 Tax=Cryobacterium sp. N19 TaxID=2048288 RepID=UPI001125081D|nr:hypothetical protein [Cryobacterium sp. N19]